MRPPEHPAAVPEAERGDADLVQVVDLDLIVAGVAHAGAEVLTGRHDLLVGGALHRDGLVAQVDAQHGRRAGGGEVIDLPGAVDLLGPADLRALAGVAVGRLPRFRLRDGVDRRVRGDVRDDEGLPVAVDLLRRGDHRGVDRRSVGPAGDGDQVRDRVVLGVELLDRSEAGRGAVRVDRADDGRAGHEGDLDRVVGDRLGRGQDRDRGDDDHVLLGVVGDVEVGALHLAGHADGVEDHVVAVADLHGTVREVLIAQRDLRVLVRVGIQHVDHVDRAAVRDGVVEVLREGFAEGVAVPVVEVAERGSRLVHVPETDRGVDDAGGGIPRDQVDRGGADVDQYGVGLSRGHGFALGDFAVGAVLVCHGVVLLLTL